MFHGLRRLAEFPLVTADGERRAIRGFLFDDRTWQIRYLVVDAGNWLAPKMVVVATSAVAFPDWEEKRVGTRLTLEGLLASPSAETVRPVSKQQQQAWNRHFGWPDGDPYWAGGWSGAVGREFESEGTDDPHLRGTEDLRGYAVREGDAPVGKLEGYLVEDGSWRIGYLLLYEGEWVYRERLIPTGRVSEISWGEHRVMLDGGTETRGEKEPRAERRVG